MQGTGNYRSASGPSASACRHAFAPVAGEEVEKNDTLSLSLSLSLSRLRALIYTKTLKSQRVSVPFFRDLSPFFSQDTVNPSSCPHGAGGLSCCSAVCGTWLCHARVPLMPFGGMPSLVFPLAYRTRKISKRISHEKDFTHRTAGCLLPPGHVGPERLGLRADLLPSGTP